MAGIPRQRGTGSPKFGNTSRGHHSNRINSIRRGGEPHMGGGGGGGKKDCALVLLVGFGSMLGLATLTFALITALTLVGIE